VDDATETALGHRVDRRLHELDRRQHVGIDRLDPFLAAPLPEVAGRRAAGVVDEDVDLRACGQRRAAAGLGRDIARDRAHLAAAESAQLGGRRLEHLGAPRRDDDVNTLSCQRCSAAFADPLARRADERPFAFDAQIHCYLHLARSQMPASTSTVPATIQPVNGSPRMMTLIRIVDSGPIMPVCAATDAPTRSIAIITMSTGAKVQSVALSTESQMTCGATASANIGLNTMNCAMQNRHATLVARPVRRKAPMRLTSSPLATR